MDIKVNFGRLKYYVPLPPEMLYSTHCASGKKGKAAATEENMSAAKLKVKELASSTLKENTLEFPEDVLHNPRIQSSSGLNQFYFSADYSDLVHSLLCCLMGFLITEGYYQYVSLRKEELTDYRWSWVWCTVLLLHALWLLAKVTVERVSVTSGLAVYLPGLTGFIGFTVSLMLAYFNYVDVSGIFSDFVSRFNSSGDSHISLEWLLASYVNNHVRLLFQIAILSGLTSALLCSSLIQVSTVMYTTSRDDDNKVWVVSNVRQALEYFLIYNFVTKDPNYEEYFMPISILSVCLHLMSCYRRYFQKYLDQAEKRRIIYLNQPDVVTVTIAAYRKSIMFIYEGLCLSVSELLLPSVLLLCLSLFYILSESLFVKYFVFWFCANDMIVGLITRTFLRAIQ